MPGKANVISEWISTRWQTWKQTMILRLAREEDYSSRIHTMRFVPDIDWQTGTWNDSLRRSEGSASEEARSYYSQSRLNASPYDHLAAANVQRQFRIINEQVVTSGLSHDSKNNFTFRGNRGDLSRLSVNFSRHLSYIPFRSPTDTICLFSAWRVHQKRRDTNKRDLLAEISRPSETKDQI